MTTYADIANEVVSLLHQKGNEEKSIRWAVGEVLDCKYTDIHRHKHRVREAMRLEILAVLRKRAVSSTKWLAKRRARKRAALDKIAQRHLESF